MTTFTPQENTDLTHLLSLAGDKGEVRTLDGLHGDLFGLSLIHEPIMLIDWLPGIFGDALPEVYKEDGNRLFGALFAAYARMIKENEDGLLTFQDDAESAKKVMDMVQIHEWAHGFVLGSSLRHSTWGMDKEKDPDDSEPKESQAYSADKLELLLSLAIAMGLAFPVKIPQLFKGSIRDIFPLDAPTTEKEAVLASLLPIAVAKLKKHANVVRDKKRELKADNYPETPLPRLAKKTGRNAPCPCGSGAKYKKCCGK